MASCLTITLNPAVDVTYVVNAFALGEANRASRVYRMPGGKGNNVARVLRAHQHQVTAAGFLGGHAGEFIQAGLAAAGINARFTWLEGKASRSCHTVLDESSGTATEILEPGPVIADIERETLLRSLPGFVDAVDVVIISGSAPSGTPQAFLERLARLVRERAPRMVVDSSGATLTALLSGRPDLIKPNEHELAVLMGRQGTEAERIAFAREHLVRAALASNGRVLISQGRDGAVLVSDETVHRARSPAIAPVNTVGCGDALLAGFVDAWLAAADPPTALRQAVAFGTAAALQPVAGVVEQNDVERLMPGVELTEDMSSPRR